MSPGSFPAESNSNTLPIIDRLGVLRVDLLGVILGGGLVKGVNYLLGVLCLIKLWFVFLKWLLILLRKGLLFDLLNGDAMDFWRLMLELFLISPGPIDRLEVLGN